MIGKVAVVGAALAVVGVIGLGAEMSHGNPLAAALDSVSIDQTKSVSTQGIHHIDLEVGMGELTVTPGRGNAINVHVYGDASKTFMQNLNWNLYKTGDTTTLSFKHQFRWSDGWVWLAPNYANVRIDVTVPNRQFDQWVIETGSANVSATQLQAIHLHVTSGSGNIFLESTRGDLMIRSGSGNVEVMNHPTQGVFNVISGSGNVHVVPAGTLHNIAYTLTSGSGNIHFLGMRTEHHLQGKIGQGIGTFQIMTGSGNIDVSPQ